jgi:nitrite reductase/ring-hydroxylating ferredoxin subunit
VCSGAVLEGPDVCAQPGYEVRAKDGNIELRGAPAMDH